MGLLESRVRQLASVTMLSHMLDCQLYGLKPWGHHLTSLLLHALNTVLVFFFCATQLAQSGGARWWRHCSAGTRCGWNRRPGWRSGRMY